MWDPDELISCLLDGGVLSRRKTACLRDHLLSVRGRLTPKEAAAAQALDLAQMLKPGQRLAV